MKIAILGAGVSGLTAAYYLHREHEITLFEAAGQIGGHVNTVDVDVDGSSYAIDTGFVVFNDRTYPNFSKLLKELKVACHPTTMSFSVRDDQTGLEYNGHSLNGLFTQRRNLLRRGFHRMLLDVVRFNKEATGLVTRGGENLTVREFLQRHQFSAEFAQFYLLPMGAAIWSCPIGTIANFPIRFIAEFYHNHGLLSLLNRPQWYVIGGGARTYVNRLIDGFQDRIRINTPITRVRRYNDRVVVEQVGGEVERFDHIVFACHSDQALKLLENDATPTEREVLAAFPYSRNVAILHTDESQLPRSRRAWASWNYRTGEDNTAPPTVTYNMNILQGLRASKTFCVTLNDEVRIDANKILRRFEYHHPVFTLSRAAAQARQNELLNVNRTSFCGAYWRNGFHEDGVVSGLAVAKTLQKQDTNTLGEKLRSFPLATAAGAG